MSSEITIDGKTYRAKRASMDTLIRCSDIEEDMRKAREAREYDKHRELSIKRCQLFLEGDDVELATDRIAPADLEALDAFFVSCLGRNARPSEDGNETSPDSSEKTQA